MSAIRGPRLRPSEFRETLRVLLLAQRVGAAAPELHLVVDLVLVGQVVDEPGAHGVLGQEGSVVDEVADLGGRPVPARGEAGHELFVEIGIERLGHLAVRRRERVLGEGVRRRLVVTDVQRIRERAELVERAAQEELVVRHAGEVERRRRHEEHLVAGARQVIRLVAAILEVGHDRLLRFLELEDGVADFLHLAPERGVAGRPDDDARHPPIDGRLAQRVDGRAHGWRRDHELAEVHRPVRLPGGRR